MTIGGRAATSFVPPADPGCGTLRGDDRRQREQNWSIGRAGHGLEVVAAVPTAAGTAPVLLAIITVPASTMAISQWRHEAGVPA